MLLTKHLLNLAKKNDLLRHALFSTQTLTNNSHYDIIISGGGLVGTTLACSLAKSNRLCEKRILLLEGAPTFKRTNIEGNNDSYGMFIDIILYCLFVFFLCIIHKVTATEFLL